MNYIVWILSTTTYVGVVPGAYHYRGFLCPRHDFNHPSIELERKMTAQEARNENRVAWKQMGIRLGVRAGDTTYAFLSLADLRREAITQFTRIRHTDRDILLQGNRAVMDPQLALAGPLDLICNANRLYVKFERLGGWDVVSNHDEVQCVANEWEALIPYDVDDRT